MRGILYKVVGKHYYGIEIHNTGKFTGSVAYAIFAALASKTKIDVNDIYFPAGTLYEFDLVVLNGFTFSIGQTRPSKNRLERIGLVNYRYLPIIWALKSLKCPPIHKGYERETYLLTYRWYKEDSEK